MKQVDFYLISNGIADANFKLASRLANKLQRQQLKTLIVTDQADMTSRLDQIMWSFSDASFAAHDVLQASTDGMASSATPATIHIADTDTITPEVLSGASSEGGYDVLINLCDQMPLFCHHFNRIAEIVMADESAKAAARERFKSYQKEGFEIKTHTIEL